MAKLRHCIQPFALLFAAVCVLWAIFVSKFAAPAQHPDTFTAFRAWWAAAIFVAVYTICTDAFTDAAYDFIWWNSGGREAFELYEAFYKECHAPSPEVLRPSVVFIRGTTVRPPKDA